MNGSTPTKGAKPFSWLVIFFGVAYFCQHFGQAGLINQPLTFYFKEVLHYGADQIATFFAILTIPWMIKPAYGLICDYFPLFGYRRKSYLLILNLAAACGFFAISGFSDTATIRMALLLTAFGTAFSDVAIDGLMVELGKSTGRTAQFQSMQWLWFNVAMVISSLAGGLFTQYLPVASAYRVAAIITAVFPLCVVVATWFWVKEKKSKMELAGLKSTTMSLWQALKSRTLWIVVAFIAFWQFSPSFGTPMYIHQTDTLKFSQGFIGILNALGSCAAVVGALCFNRFLADKYSTKTLLYWSAGTGVIGTLAYMLMLDPATTAGPVTAITLNLVFGIVGQISMLTTLNLAAENCPKHVEALTFACLMSVFNLSAQGSSIFGSYLFEHVFAKSMFPLIIVSAVFTLACIPLIPLLPVTPKKVDDEEVKEDGEAKS
ncbi:MAG: MFS transporter [Candidatus Obscuribacterales bacterium]|nr:MFS transporter [Candidatus Obscuribacterales bacterium]